VPDFQTRLQNAIGHEFLIERELGGGGMSRVFVATERALQRRVVVKVLPPELAAGVNVERFRREIQLAAGLQHPHIVPLLSAGDDKGLLWFTMPFIEGESLRGALTRQKRLPVRDVVRILHDVVDALAYAHARGVVHRDIKPDNILTSGLHALVTDFGVAKALSAAIPMHGGTTTGMAIGTPAYMAPEQLAADPAADHRVDLYAVGLLAYELLTGHSPFTSASPQATLAAQLTVMPEPPHLSLAEIPEELSATIMHCLEKDAAKRPASAHELLAELDALPPMALASGNRAASRAGARRRTRAIAASVAVIAVAVVAILTAQRTQTTRAAAVERAFAAGRRDTMSARDAGRGGSRTPTMEIADAATLRSGRVKPETVIVAFRDSMNADGSRSVQVPVVISRADSLAIAAAIQQRMQSAPFARQAPTSDAQAQPTVVSGVGTGGGAGDGATEQAAGGGGSRRTSDATSFRAVDPRAVAGRGIMDANAAVDWKLGRDELIAEVRRVFTDSMMVAVRGMDSALAHAPRFVRTEPGRPARAMVAPLVGPNTDGRTRLVLTPFTNATGRGEMSRFGQDVAGYLRASLSSERFDIVDAGTTERAARSTSDRMAMGWMLRSDFVISGVVRDRSDSLAVLMVLTDVRGGRHSRAEEYVAPKGEPQRVMDAALQRVSTWLDSARVRTGMRGASGKR